MQITKLPIIFKFGLSYAISSNTFAKWYHASLKWQMEVEQIQPHFFEACLTFGLFFFIIWMLSFPIIKDYKIIFGMEAQKWPAEYFLLLIYPTFKWKYGQLVWGHILIPIKKIVESFIFYTGFGILLCIPLISILFTADILFAQLLSPEQYDAYVSLYQKDTEQLLKDIKVIEDSEIYKYSREPSPVRTDFVYIGVAVIATVLIFLWRS